jgi:1-deoxy-D-xylulose-5-phosphate reductoisomerase
MRKSLIVLGSTGSIGRQTLEVVSHLNALHARGQSPLAIDIVGLAAGNNRELLLAQAREHGVHTVALACAPEGKHTDDTITIIGGQHSAHHMVESIKCDMVVAAMVGVAGLPATLAAIARGCDVALANKETLVAAGTVIVPAAKSSGSNLLPVDSEHAGVWECLWSRIREAPPLTLPASVRRVVLTASGGPFRTWPMQAMERATPHEASMHPTWKMGGKVTLDSASLMNKGLELIEAHWLFGIPAENLDAVIHPQSIVHAILDFHDGSTLAQLAHPDMRLPIHSALVFPDHAPGMVRPLDLSVVSQLTFEPVDPIRFPAVALAKDVVVRSATHPGIGAWFNASNEVLGESFLRGEIGFLDIARGVREVVETIAGGPSANAPIVTLQDVQQADALARAAALTWIRSRSTVTT